MFEQAFKNIDDILWKDVVVDTFPDQQHDSMDGGGRNASGTAFEERYKEQLKKYGALMELHGDEPVKLGLYFPLLQGWREWGYSR